MMDENLYQSSELSTSSLPPSVLMSVDHGDPKAIGHCAMIALTHARARSHTHGGRHLGNSRGISELKGDGGGGGSMGSQYVT